MDYRKTFAATWPIYAKKIEAEMHVLGIHAEFKHSFFEPEFWQSSSEEVTVSFTDANTFYTGSCFFVPVKDNNRLVLCDPPEKIDYLPLPKNN